MFSTIAKGSSTTLSAQAENILCLCVCLYVCPTVSYVCLSVVLSVTDLRNAISSDPLHQFSGVIVSKKSSFFADVEAQRFQSVIFRLCWKPS